MKIPSNFPWWSPIKSISYKISQTSSETLNIITLTNYIYFLICGKPFWHWHSAGFTTRQHRQLLGSVVEKGTPNCLLVNKKKSVLIRLLFSDIEMRRQSITYSNSNEMIYSRIYYSIVYPIRYFQEQGIHYECIQWLEQFKLSEHERQWTLHLYENIRLKKHDCNLFNIASTIFKRV